MDNFSGISLLFVIPTIDTRALRACAHLTTSPVSGFHRRGGMDLSTRHAGLLHRLLCRATRLTRSPITPPRGLGVTRADSVDDAYYSLAFYTLAN